MIDFMVNCRPLKYTYGGAIIVWSHPWTNSFNLETLLTTCVELARSTSKPGQLLTLSCLFSERYKFSRDEERSDPPHLAQSEAPGGAGPNDLSDHLQQ